MFTAQPVTNSFGSPYRGDFDQDNTATSGLANLISIAEKTQVTDVEFKITVGNKNIRPTLRDVIEGRFKLDKFSLIALKLRSEGVDMETPMEFANHKGFQILRTEDGTGYKSKKGLIFEI